MSKIVVLDELTACQIAAGEVIERPASVVKELAENSIDAGATSISVEIRSGGVKYIKITDNGCGFEADDAVIAFDKHATSKIKSGDDLNEIATLGFRGEALASIAAVSDVELLSKTQDAGIGVYVRIKGCDVLETGEKGSPNGTSITVRDLFYNTPARYKFLKKDGTEASYVADVLQKLAIANPNISFKLISNGNEVFRTPGNGDLKSVIFSIYGKETAASLLPVNYEDNNCKIYGFTGIRDAVYSNRTRQLFFVNGRCIRSKIITSALDEAYKTVTMKNKFPFAVLQIEVPLSKVDVNVHPTKSEVRFSDDSLIYKLVYNGVTNAVLFENNGNSAWISKIPQKPASQVVNLNKTYGFYNEKEAMQNKASISVGSNHLSEVQTNRATETIKSTNSAQKDIDNTLNDIAQKREEIQNIISEKDKELSLPKNDDFPEIWKSEKADADVSIKKMTEIEKEFDSQPKISQIVNQDDSENSVQETLSENQIQNIQKNQEIFKEDESNHLTIENSLPDIDKHTDMPQFVMESDDTQPVLYNSTNVYTDSIVVGQVFDTYIILQYGKEMVLIDQHAAHERIKYEEIKDVVNEGTGAISPLFVPITMTLSPAELTAFQSNTEFFESLGFEIDEFGGNTIIIRAVPTILSESNIEDVILSALQNKKTKGYTDEEIYTMACKAAVKANKRLSAFEIDELLKKLAKLENSGTCPHGRPICVTITEHELEKKFKRCL